MSDYDSNEVIYVYSQKGKYFCKYSKAINSIHPHGNTVLSG